jgi:hypothetical protein
VIRPRHLLSLELIVRGRSALPAKANRQRRPWRGMEDVEFASGALSRLFEALTFGGRCASPAQQLQIGVAVQGYPDHRRCI